MSSRVISSEGDMEYIYKALPFPDKERSILFFSFFSQEHILNLLQEPVSATIKKVDIHSKCTRRWLSGWHCLLTARSLWVPLQARACTCCMFLCVRGFSLGSFHSPKTCEQMNKSIRTEAFILSPLIKSLQDRRYQGCFFDPSESSDGFH